MKKLLLTFISVTVLFAGMLAQSPQAFKYQVVVRNNSGEILQNQSVGVRINIHDATLGGAIVYQETFTEITNQYGLVNLQIGTGFTTIGVFSGINWGNSAKFLEIEIDLEGVGTYVSMGTTELLSVPYALYAERSKDALWEKSENAIYYNNGKVGIGTALPSGSLDVRGTDPDDGVVFNIGNSDLSHKITLFGGRTNDPNPFLMWKEGDPLRFVTDAGGFSEKMRITTDGNLGIGTTTPGALLEVSGHIWQTGIGESIFIGEGAGANDDLSTNQNVYIGKDVGNTNSTGWRNTANGYSSFFYNTTGNRNAAYGSLSLCYNTTGYYNTAVGYKSLYENNEGYYNSATGSFSLNSNTTGNHNTANGYLTLYSNTTGFSNVAIGSNALYHNTNRSNLVAVGDSALYNNGNGVVYLYEANQNTALGSKALFSNTRGVHLTASGFESLYSNTTGEYNTANGSYSLLDNTEGSFNTATGFQSLSANTTGSYNTAHGVTALAANTTGDYNTAIGHWSLGYSTVGDFNTSLGYYASTGLNYSASNSTGIGYNAQPEYSNRIMLGNTAVTWIGGYSSWYVAADASAENSIIEDVKGLDFIMELRPVTYYFDIDRMGELTGIDDLSSYPQKYDKENIKQSGFIAQEVVEAATKSGYDFSGIRKPKNGIKYYSLAYAEFVVPMVKAIQEQQALIENQQAVIEELYLRIKKLERSK